MKVIYSDKKRLIHVHIYNTVIKRTQILKQSSMQYQLHLCAQREHGFKHFAVAMACISIFFFSFKKISANDYVFTVHTTKACPKYQMEMDERSLALNCTKRNGYTCLPDKTLTVLLEFCYKRARIAVPKG